MDRKYSRLLCRAIPNSSISCPPPPAIMRLRRVRFSNGATNLYWVRLYTAQYVLSVVHIKCILIVVLAIWGFSAWFRAPQREVFIPAEDVYFAGAEIRKL